MPSSFDSMHDEIRPLRMLEEDSSPRSPLAVTLASVLLVVAPVLAALTL